MEATFFSVPPGVMVVVERGALIVLPPSRAFELVVEVEPPERFAALLARAFSISLALTVPPPPLLIVLPLLVRLIPIETVRSRSRSPFVSGKSSKASSSVPSP